MTGGTEFPENKKQVKLFKYGEFQIPFFEAKAGVEYKITTEWNWTNDKKIVNTD